MSLHYLAKRECSNCIGFWCHWWWHGLTKLGWTIWYSLSDRGLKVSGTYYLSDSNSEATACVSHLRFLHSQVCYNPGARFTKNLMPNLWQRSSYAELVNCEGLTKNHKLNLRKIYAKLMKLWTHKCCHKSIIRGNYVILLTLGHFQYSLIKQKVHRIKSMTHLNVFCWNIFKRDISDAAYAPIHVAQVFTFKSIFQLSFACGDRWLPSQNWL